jgi:hypothetical protein
MKVRHHEDPYLDLWVLLKAEVFPKQENNATTSHML